VPVEERPDDPGEDASRKPSDDRGADPPGHTRRECRTAEMVAEERDGHGGEPGDQEALKGAKDQEDPEARGERGEEGRDGEKRRARDDYPPAPDGVGERAPDRRDGSDRQDDDRDGEPRRRRRDAKPGGEDRENRLGDVEVREDGNSREVQRQETPLRQK
jgi:hypothetical protein